MAKVLYLEKMGATDIEGLNNVGSTRVNNFNIGKFEGEKGEITVEFSRGQSFNKKGGIQKYWLYVDACYYDNEGKCWAMLDICRCSVDKKLDFTLENILKIANIISLEKFDKVEII